MTRDEIERRAVIEVRNNDDGTLDEIVADGAFFHLEQMDAGLWWMAVEHKGQRVAVWLRARGKITANVEIDGVMQEPTVRAKKLGSG